MKIPTAGPPADTETLREQIATARDALSAAVASLDGAMQAAAREYGHLSGRYGSTMQLVNRLCDALENVKDAARALDEWGETPVTPTPAKRSVNGDGHSFVGGRVNSRCTACGGTYEDHTADGIRRLRGEPLP